ncbi:hypothetical protein DENSPDRAFT_109708 [Dentipellis sp. KUC8613]|nr:hypothetical protein DENSPDRAFT_109708 [Dentipellis sp. KUC8613]
MKGHDEPIILPVLAWAIGTANSCHTPEMELPYWLAWYPASDVIKLYSKLLHSPDDSDGLLSFKLQRRYLYSVHAIDLQQNGPPAPLIRFLFTLHWEGNGFFQKSLSTGPQAADAERALVLKFKKDDDAWKPESYLLFVERLQVVMSPLIQKRCVCRCRSDSTSDW